MGRQKITFTQRVFTSFLWGSLSILHSFRFRSQCFLHIQNLSNFDPSISRFFKVQVVLCKRNVSSISTEHLCRHKLNMRRLSQETNPNYQMNVLLWVSVLQQLRSIYKLPYLVTVKVRQNPHLFIFTQLQKCKIS